MMSHTCNPSPPKAEEKLFHDFETSLSSREKPCLAFVKATENSVLPMHQHMPFGRFLCGVFRFLFCFEA